MKKIFFPFRRGFFSFRRDVGGCGVKRTMQREIIGKMNRILLFAVLCAAACFSTGCGAFLQTSYKIYEIRALYYFPDVYQATADCKLDGKMYLKCPLLRYTQKNSWFFVVITPTMFGDEYHVFHSYAGPDEYVWIQKEENEQGGHSWYLYDPAAMPPDAELEKHAEKRATDQREGVPEYDCGSAGRHFYSGVDDSKPRVP